MPKNSKQPAPTKDTVQQDTQDIRQELISKAKKGGQIDQRDIFEAIPDTPENAEALDSFYTELADAGVEITANAVMPEDAPVITDDEWTLEDGEEVIVEDQ